MEQAHREAERRRVPLPLGEPASKLSLHLLPVSLRGVCARTCFILQVLLDTEGIDAYDQVGLSYQVPTIML